MEATLSYRQEDILSYIRTSVGGISTHELAGRLDCPEASVRRDVGALRKAGHNIQRNYWGYYLAPAVTPAPAEVAEDLAGTFSAL